MSNTSDANNSEIQTERDSRSDRSLDEPHYGDQDEPLNLPRKNGESQSSLTSRQENSGTNTNRQQQPDTKSRSQEKEISLGEYGSVTLPKKNGSSTTSQPQTTNQGNATTNRNSGVRTIELNPQTKRAEGIMKNVTNQALLVLDGKVLQVSSLENSEIYMDEKSFCTVSGGSNNVIYLLKDAQLLLTGDGSHNVIYYEQGSSVRNGMSGSNNQLVEMQSLSFK